MADYDADSFFSAERKRSICDGCQHYPCTTTEEKMVVSCPAFSYRPKPRTNYDRIRDMSVEEMAEMISTYLDCAECRNMIGYKPCRNGACCPDFWLDWLKQEVTE